MRKRRAFNFPAFMEATSELLQLGHEVFNPAQRDIDTGFDPLGMTGFEDLNDGTHRFDLREALAADTAWIATQAEALCLLPGWEESSGARAEVALAAALGLQAGELADFYIGNTLRPAADFYAARWNANPPKVEGEPVRIHLTANRPGTPGAPLSVNPGAASLGTLSIEDLGGRDGDGSHEVIPQGDEVRLTSSTGGQKGDKEARFDLIPARPLWELATLYGRGAQKYAERNWESGYEFHLSFSAAMRHAWSWWNGEDRDPETGVSHLVNAAWHLLNLVQLQITHPEHDDRPQRRLPLTIPKGALQRRPLPTPRGTI
jgi:hypothetical protein